MRLPQPRFEKAQVVVERVLERATAELAGPVAPTPEAGPVPVRLVPDRLEALAPLRAPRIEGRVDVDQPRAPRGLVPQDLQVVAEDDSGHVAWHPGPPPGASAAQCTVAGEAFLRASSDPRRFSQRSGRARQRLCMNMGTPASPQLEELMTHSAWLRRLAKTLVRDAAAADDLVQETWLAALKNPPDPSRPARPWLAGVMRRLVAMRARGEARRARRQRTAARAEGLPSTAELVEGVDTQRRIAKAVLELSEPYRTTVLLRYYQQLSSAEIARRQGIPAATVRWRLSRGLADLRGGLDQLWPDRRSWCLALLALERAHDGGATFPSGSAGGPAGGATAVSTEAAAATGVGLLGVPLLQLAQWSALALFVLAAGWFALVGPPEGGASEGEDLLSPAAVPADAVASIEVDASPASTESAREPVPVRPRTPHTSGSGTAPPAATGDVPSTVRVLLPDGSPARGLRTVALAADGELVEGSTDDDGRFDLGSLARPTELYVKRPESFLARARLDAETTGSMDRADAVVVHLPAGDELSGRLLLGGRRPAESIVLTLTRDQPLFGDEDAPEPVRERMRAARLAHARTGEDGSFRFVGLDAGWHGTLRLPPGYRFSAAHGPDEASRGRVVAVESPGTGLELSIEVERAISGRTVDPTGRAVAARVECLLVSGKGRERRVALSSGADGRFGAVLQGEYDSALVRAWGPGSVASTLVALPPGGLDLGDLALRPARRLRLEVAAPDGKPVAELEAGAARPGDAVLWPGVREPDGSLSIELPMDFEGEVLVDAFGFRSQRIAVGALDRMVVELAPAATLRVGVTSAGGEDLPPTTLVLRGVVPGREHEVRAAAGRPVTDGVPVPGELRFACDRSGRVEVDGLLGDERLQLEVVDPLGNVIAGREVVLDGARDHSVAVSVRDLRVFAGTVRDDTGGPLVGAAIVLTSPEGPHWRLRTDREGHFHITHGEAGPVRVEITKAGFEDLILDGVRIDGQVGQDLRLRRSE